MLPKVDFLKENILPQIVFCEMNITKHNNNLTALNKHCS